MAAKQLDSLLSTQNGKCFFCHAQLPRERATIEHLHPKSKGGTNATGNCVACCFELNQTLGADLAAAKLRKVMALQLRNKDGGRFFQAQLAKVDAAVQHTLLPPLVHDSASHWGLLQLIAAKVKPGVDMLRGWSGLKAEVQAELSGCLGFKPSGLMVAQVAGFIARNHRDQPVNSDVKPIVPPVDNARMYADIEMKVLSRQTLPQSSFTLRGAVRQALGKYDRKYMDARYIFSIARYIQRRNRLSFDFEVNELLPRRPDQN